MTEDQLITDIMRREGWPKYTDHPFDKGGSTKGGITLPTLSASRGRPCTVADLQALEEPEARDIYRFKYVRPWDWVSNERLRALLADYEVLFGHDDPTIALQMAVGVTADGVVGARTKAALLAANLGEVYYKVWRHRLDQHFAKAFGPDVKQFLKEHEESQLHNLHGWVNRLGEFV